MDKLAESAGNQLIDKYGMSGIVIAALFAAVYMLYREVTKKQDDINALHIEHTKTIIDIQKSQREEIERINIAHDANVERVANILTTQIKESNEGGRQDRLNATAAFNKIGEVINNMNLSIRELTTIIQQQNNRQLK